MPKATAVLFTNAVNVCVSVCCEKIKIIHTVGREICVETLFHHTANLSLAVTR